MGRLTRTAALLVWVAAVACCSHAMCGAWADNSSVEGGGSGPATSSKPASAGCTEVDHGVELCTSLLPPSSSSQEEDVMAAGVVPNDVPAAWNDTDIETSDAFFLHSRPGAKRTIFLAFAGCVTTVRAVVLVVCSCMLRPFFSTQQRHSSSGVTAAAAAHALSGTEAAI